MRTLETAGSGSPTPGASTALLSTPATTSTSATRRWYLYAASTKMVTTDASTRRTGTSATSQHRTSRTAGAIRHTTEQFEGARVRKYEKAFPPVGILDCYCD
ncbi:hypothetical protein MPH_03621 [Macrophomina phaseolina MS6]|uniref:Uncharacterized protein n=1 Tax=Macrophomina phaseolina (strain MS6) TaxID=1126212 RepID=K2SQZ9_MACPH|nr:hypothetical protein MPH_03621 [Macrophomina phaseolina MS6]